MTPDGLPPLREVIAAHGLTAKKSFGQNFILDLNLTQRIARAAGPLAGKTVVEIGPGPGGLTRALFLEGAERIVAIERDPRCLPALAEISGHYPGRFEVIEGDALEVEIRPHLSGPTVVVANLPYAVATMLLVGWLTIEPWPPWFDSLTLMFQKEVAERIVALPGTKAFGRLAVLAQWRTTPRILFSLPPQAFTPPPKVESAVIQLIPRAQPLPAGSSTVLGKLTAAAFGQRRKMLRASLRQIVADPEVLLGDCGIPPEKRAEQLTVAEFCRIASMLSKRPAS
ncbi:MAG: 16S rRNA (adenine(1518)-N(6)/adenine(1519)-N(6))-dimethyltransferase RsmA [Hyphomicrobiaceae bacterium]